jgi:hypothetical protein
MVSRTRARTRKGSGEEDHRNTRVQFFYHDIHSLKPYDFNPRDNAAAIDSVANSIKTFGFLVPVVIDNNDILVAGHTRVEAAKKLGLSEVPAVRAEHLTEDQINAFRIIDNKVSELASWDFSLLAGEIQKLSNSGIVLTEFGWDQDALDCLTATVASDCLSTDTLIDVEEMDRLRRAERRAPVTARYVLGEIVFFIPQTDYRRWVDAIRVQHDYNEADIIADIKHRLGIVEESVVAVQRATGRRTRTR